MTHVGQQQQRRPGYRLRGEEPGRRRDERVVATMDDERWYVDGAESGSPASAGVDRCQLARCALGIEAAVELPCARLALLVGVAVLLGLPYEAVDRVLDVCSAIGGWR